MKRITPTFVLFVILLSGKSLQAQSDLNPDHTGNISQQELQEDFRQFRRILEEEHCCTYAFTPKAELDSLFDDHLRRIDRDMKLEEFFGLLAPITAKIGCMHTATWMPGSFFITKPDMLFPLQLKLIDPYVVVSGSYRDTCEVPLGSILLEINGRPMESIIDHLRDITSADALNPYFKDAQLTHRFSMFYASLFGLPEKYEVTYALPGRKTHETKEITGVDIESVREVVFAHFNNPPLTFQILEEGNTALMTVSTFIYYDRVDYFGDFMDSCFHLIKEREIENLILDLRGNGGGDPFCASILLSYLQPEPLPYFAEPYGRYNMLADPVPLPDNHFTGSLYTFLDGSCGSTNGHFCALLDYHQIGMLVGTPSGATYSCNAGRNTELRLTHSQLIITIGRSSFAAAVKNMDKSAPIMPDVAVKETYKAFLDNRDLYMETALEQIEADN